MPSITQQPQSQTVVAPANASFSVTASGQSPLSYQWSCNGTNLSDSAHIGGATTSLLTISNVAAADAGSYAVVVSNRKGSVASSVATLTVLVPATILSQPANQAVFLGSNALFAVSATGTAPLAYQWYFNSTALNGATTSTLNLLNVQLSDAGNYQVVVSNAFGMATSQTAALSVAVGNGSAVMRFVNLTAPQPQAPYTSWFNAATNLQDALDAANPGDQILVSNGVYALGSRVVSGMTNRVAITRAVAVTSVNGPAWTSIDGGGTMRCVSMADGSSLSGFTLTNGMSSENGGGVRCDTTNVVVSNCVFAANSAYIQGGGAFRGTLITCRLTNNTAHGVAQGYPGGGAAGSSVLKQCLVSGNVTANYGMGGGLFNCRADQCLISSNSSPMGLAGGASQSTLNNCLLVGNYAGSQGGGADSCTLNNCTVVNNTTYLGAGGGISASTANNCIIYYNAFQDALLFGATPDQTNCANSTVNDSCTTPLPTNGVGNLTRPPGFVNPAANDFHLSATSPCIGTANNAYVVGATDLDGNPRLIGPVVDMGAFEYQPPTITITTQPVSQAPMAGQTVQFSVAAISPYPLSYQWLFNDAPLSDGPRLAGSTTASLVINNAQLGDSGNYSVQLSNPFTTVTSTVASLSVLVPPSFTQQPASQTVGVGTNAAFSAAANGSTLSYQWYHNGSTLADSSHITGALTSTLNLSSAQSSDAGSYCLVITNAVGSATSAVATLTVLAPPAFTQQPTSQVAAVGSNALFSAAVNGSALSYQWYFNSTALADTAHVAGALTSHLNLSNVQSTDIGSYYLVVSNPAGVLTSAVATLSVLIPPSFSQQPASQTVGVGTNASFSAIANGSTLSYQWYFNGTALADSAHIAGALTNTLNLSSAQFSDAGTYYLVARNPVGTATSVVAFLTVLLPPSLTQQPTSQIAAVGSNAVFSASASGSALRYQWYFNGTALVDNAHVTGSLANRLSLFNVQTADAGGYYLVVSNPAGVVTSTVATLSVFLPPSFTQQPASQTVVLGTNLVFSATAEGTALGYQWYFNGTALADSTHLAGALTSNLSISNAQTADAGSYYVVASNAVGTATSTAATLTVLTPPTVMQQPLGRSVPAGLPTTFSAAGSGTAPLSYQWQLNGTDIANATNSTYTIAAVGPSNLGAYHLVVSNAAGVAVSTEALLTFGPVAAWGRNDSRQCLPPPGLSNVIAVAGGANYSLALRSDGTVVAWGSFTGTNLPAGLSNVVAIAAGSDDAGLALRADGSVVSWNSVLPAPAGLSNQVAVAGGFNYGLALGAAGVVTGWGSPPTGLRPLPPAIVPAGLTKVGAIAAGGSQSVALRTDGSVVAWGSGVGTNVPPGLTNAVAVGSGCRHGLALRADGTVTAWGTTSATNVPAGLTNVAAIAAGGYAQGNGQSLAVLSNGLVVAWGDNSFNETTVPPALSNVVAGACGAYHTLALVADGRPVLLQPPVGGTAYSGSRFKLSGVASGTAPLSYQWLFNGTALVGATTSTLNLTGIQASDAGTYQLVVTNAQGAVASVPVPVTVLESAPFFVQQPPQTNTPPVGSPCSLGTAVAGSGPLQLQWQWNGHPLPEATTDTLSFDFLRRTNAGPYTLVASNVFGVVTSTVAMLWPATVLSWGGLDVTAYQTNVPVTLTNAVAIAAGFNSSMALRADGTAIGWGNAFLKIPDPGFSNLVEIATGPAYSLGLTTTGTVVGTGIPATWLAGLSNIVALEIDNGESIFLRSDGTLARLNSNGALSFPAEGTNAIALASAYQGYVVLRADGTVLYSSMRLLQTNALGMAPCTAPSSVQLFLKPDGTVQGAGGLVVPASLSNGLDVAVMSGSGLVLRADGTPLAINPASYVAPTPPAVSNMAAVQGGNYHYAALLSEQPFPRVLLPAALNTTAYVVSSKSSPQWFGQTNVTHDGAAAAQSAPIERNTQSSMRTLVAGPVTVSFWWKVSSQTNRHTLAFSAGGAVLTNLSGEVDWQPCTMTIPAGNQMLQWTYAKDDSPSAGQDAAWVDQLVITPIAPAILAQPASQTVLGGSNVFLAVTATGTPPLSYFWAKNGVTLPPPGSPGLAFLKATRTNSGTYSVVVSNLAGSVTSSNAVLVVHVPQLLGTPARQADGTLLFTSYDKDGGRLSAGDLANLQVQFSTNLADWTALPGALSLTNGLLQVQDPAAANFPARFYRIVESW